MRKTCRWLGCAAWLCFTAVELSGCTSKPLVSGFKLPGRKDKDAAVAQKGKKLTAKESQDLLAQAREYDMDGNYPQAARLYKEYLNSGGEPMAQNRRTDSSTSGKAGKKSTDAESKELLAQARECEKAGDFSGASRMYSEYLSGAGQPTDASRGTASRTVAKTEKKPLDKKSPEKKSPEKTASFDKSDLDPQTTDRVTSQPKKSLRDQIKTNRKPDVAAQVMEDPWADEPLGQTDSQALADNPTDSKARPSAKLTKTGIEKKSLERDSTPASQTAAWADADAADEPLADTHRPASHSTQLPPESASEEPFQNLLDLDQGDLKRSDSAAPSQTAAVDDPLSALAEDTETPQAPPVSELPLIDFSANASESPAKPEFEDEGSPVAEVATQAEAANGAWESHEPGAEPTDELAQSEELAKTDEVDLTLPGEEQFSPPVLSDTDEAIEPVKTENTETELLSLTCKDCEPWLYAQVIKLGSSDAEVRKEGLTHLADMGRTARQAGLAVRTLLADPDPLVRAHAAWALWVIENDPWDSVATLRPLLDHSNSDVVELACYMLGDIGSQADSALDALTLLRDHADGTLRVHAAEALIRIQGVDDKSLTILTTALKSRDGQARWIAAVALGRCRGEKSAGAVTALISALKDVDPEVRSAAALSLGGLGQDAERAAPELERVVRTDDHQVREAARAALACLKP